jgi:integrase
VKANDGPWVWPIDVDRYDRSAALAAVETDMLTRYAEAYRFYRYGRTMDFGPSLDRLIRPLNDVFDYTGIKIQLRKYVLLFFLREMAERNRPFWGWTTEEWIDSIEARRTARQHVVAVAYLLCDFSDLHRLKSDHIVYNCLARKVFGREYAKVIMDRVQAKLAEWGYYGKGTCKLIMRTTFEVLLFIRSPHLKDVTLDHLRAVVARRPVRVGTECIVALSRVLASIGAVPHPLEIERRPADRTRLPSLARGVPVEWARLCRVWYERSVIGKHQRRGHYYFFLCIGRWLATTHPEVKSPADWTRDLAAEAVALICRWRNGDWRADTSAPVKNAGRLFAAGTRASRISSLRIFFRDLQDWELIPRRFDPQHSFKTPKSLLRLIGPNPRTIADDVWAKLVWAGLNLSADDLPKRGSPRWTSRSISYPIELCRAIAITWLFAGLRNDEIRRLRVGCIRWQRDEVTIPGTNDTLPADAVCLLEVPVNKTGTAFTKPVDPIVGEAIAAWEKARPQGIKLPDAKTGELVDFLFLFRLTVVGKGYLNRILIPVLCKKAGVPSADVRGNITSHRARYTIASQLFNAKEPMTLFELQEWLGHATPSATQHYAKITPTKLAKSYADAHYFARNLRAIEVLVDQELVRSGRAATESWKFYDLGHGYCTYDFFDQCPHRMACAKCSFYLPKESTKAQLLEAKANLLRLRQDIPLGDAELSAVEEGLTAYERLLVKLADVPTPAGPTPRQLTASRLVQLEVSPAAHSRTIPVPSLHSGLNAPPTASQASIPGGDSET